MRGTSFNESPAFSYVQHATTEREWTMSLTTNEPQSNPPVRTHGGIRWTSKEGRAVILMPHSDEHVGFTPDIPFADIARVACHSIYDHLASSSRDLADVPVEPDPNDDTDDYADEMFEHDMKTYKSMVAEHEWQEALFFSAMDTFALYSMASNFTEEPPPPQQYRPTTFNDLPIYRETGIGWYSCNRDMRIVTPESRDGEHDVGFAQGDGFAHIARAAYYSLRDELDMLSIAVAPLPVMGAEVVKPSLSAYENEWSAEQEQLDEYEMVEGTFFGMMRRCARYYSVWQLATRLGDVWDRTAN